MLQILSEEQEYKKARVEAAKSSRKFLVSTNLFVVFWKGSKTIDTNVE
jgi:hypothetical protein